MANNLKEALKILFFSLLITMFFFLFIEFSARVFLAVKKGDPSFMLYGFVKHKRLQSFVDSDGVKYYKSIPSKNRRNPVNQSGFRGPAIKQKQAGTCRIVCLGGSTTHGAYEDYEDIYPAILQRRLETLLGAGSYEVINAGQPGLSLKQINALVRENILTLRPDIVLVLSINNNLFAPGFWYTAHADPEDKNAPPKPAASRTRAFVTRLRTVIVNHIAAASLLDAYVHTKIYQEPWVEWDAFSEALLSDDNIWEAEYKLQLENLFQMLFTCNPDIHIVLLGQAINIIDYPMMELPFERAKDILGKKAEKYSRVSMYDTHPAIIKAAVSHVPVWQNSVLDPLHLTPVGNEILAHSIADYFVQSPHLQQCDD